MRPSGPLFAGFLLVAMGVPALLPAANAQPVGADSGQDGYVPAPHDDAVMRATYSEPMPVHGSGLPFFAGLRGSFALRDSTTAYTRTTPTNAVKAEHNLGGGGSLYYGMRLPMGLRAELEGLYRYQPLHSLAINGTPAGGAHGSAQMAAPMLNLLWELPVTDDVPVQPFLGMGAGAAYTHTNVNDGTSTYLKHDGWNLAYSFLVGANVPLSQSSRFSAMYRWMRVKDVQYGCGTGGAAASCYKSDLTNGTVDLGLEMDL